jgi:hypothetical protein
MLDSIIQTKQMLLETVQMCHSSDLKRAAASHDSEHLFKVYAAHRLKEMEVVQMALPGQVRQG